MWWDACFGVLIFNACIVSPFSHFPPDYCDWKHNLSFGAVAKLILYSCKTTVTELILYSCITTVAKPQLQNLSFTVAKLQLQNLTFGELILYCYKIQLQNLTLGEITELVIRSSCEIQLQNLTFKEVAELILWSSCKTSNLCLITNVSPNYSQATYSWHAPYPAVGHHPGAAALHQAQAQTSWGTPKWRRRGLLFGAHSCEWLLGECSCFSVGVGVGVRVIGKGVSAGVSVGVSAGVGVRCGWVRLQVCM